MTVIALTIAAPAQADERSPPAAGFYSVEASSECRNTGGDLVYLDGQGGPPVAIERAAAEPSAKPAVDARPATVEGCTLAFEHNRLSLLPHAPRVLAHRGYSDRFPANTNAAYAEALARGFDGFEADVRLTADGIAVIHHDEWLGAATNCWGSVSRAPMRWIVDNCQVVRSPVIPGMLTFAKLSKQQEPIPTVAETLDRFLCDARTAELVLDLKTTGDPRLPAALAAAMPICADDPAMAKKLTLITQAASDIAALRAASPGARIALESNRRVTGLIDQPVDRWNGSGADILSLSFNALDDVALGAVSTVLGNWRSRRNFDCLYHYNRGLPAPLGLLVWTMKGRKGISRLRSYQVDTVLSHRDYDSFVAEWIRARPRPVTLPQRCPMVEDQD